MAKYSHAVDELKTKRIRKKKTRNICVVEGISWILDNVSFPRYLVNINTRTHSMNLKSENFR